jgi:hypothetical protein
MLLLKYIGIKHADLPHCAWGHFPSNRTNTKLVRPTLSPKKSKNKELPWNEENAEEERK